MMPLLTPFSLVPGAYYENKKLIAVVPNLPFFWAAYRCWSHHKGFVFEFIKLIVALKGAEHLELILRTNSIISEPSNVLDNIYRLKKIPHLTQTDVSMGTATEELLLQKEQFSLIANELHEDELATLGKRAITQIAKRLDMNALAKDEAKAAETTHAKAPKVLEDNADNDTRKRQ